MTWTVQKCRISVTVTILDSDIWSIVKSDECVVPYRSTAVLKHAFKTAWSTFNEGTERRSSQSEVKRMEAVVRARGAHVE